ncbi:MAG: NUDIX hydrolase [Candidatus Woesearchaeota archaeon]
MEDMIIVVRALVDWYNDKMVYARRDSSDTTGGMLCLPGGKMEEDETHREAIMRELGEEIGHKPDWNIEYCFSQKPVLKNGKWYRQDYFYTYIDYVPLKPGSDEESLKVLNVNDALLRKDVAFANNTAHYFHQRVRMDDAWHPEWLLSDIQFQHEGTILTPTVFAPSYNPVLEKRRYESWMKQNSPLRQKTFPRSMISIPSCLHGLGALSDAGKECLQGRIVDMLQSAAAGNTC